CHQQPAVLPITNRTHTDRPPDRQLERPLVLREILRNGLRSRTRPVTLVEGHPRQLVDTVHPIQPQRRPPVLPRATGTFTVVQHHETVTRSEAEPSQKIGGRQAGLARPDDDDIHRVIGTHVPCNATESAYHPHRRDRSWWHPFHNAIS